MNRYKNEITNLIKNTEFDKSSIFDFEHSPFVNEFKKTFDFSKNSLNSSEKFGVKDSYIFFLNDNSVNAKAGISNGFGIICINSGLQIWNIQNLLLKKEIHEKIIPFYPEITPYLDNSINVLMYQLTMHFTFYHELGHLVQKSDYLKSHIYEKPFEIDEFDLTRHKLELDADCFSGISIASHIQQYAFKHFNNNLDVKKMEALIEIFCSSLTLYFLSFSTFQKEIYYYESTHPHPIIRILNIILTITNYLQQSPKLSKINISLNHKIIFNNSIKLSAFIETEIYKTNKTENFENILKTEMKNIIKYISKLRNFKPKEISLALEKWNKNTSNNA